MNRRSRAYAPHDRGIGQFPPEGSSRFAFNAGDSFRVSEIWDSEGEFEAFGQRRCRPRRRSRARRPAEILRSITSSTLGIPAGTRRPALRRPGAARSACICSRPPTASRAQDCGPASTLPRLVAGLREHGVELADLRHLLLSHIHLDHAGAAGSLVALQPELTVWVSEVGAPHLVDPSRLERSARRLYGEMFDPLWGELLPVPERTYGSPPATCSAGRRSRPSATRRTTSRTSATGRCSRATPRRADRAVLVRAARSPLRPTSTSRPGTRRSPRSGGASRSSSRSSTSASTPIAPRTSTASTRSSTAGPRAWAPGWTPTSSSPPRAPTSATRRRSTTASRRSSSPGSGFAATGTSGSRRAAS